MLCPIVLKTTLQTSEHVLIIILKVGSTSSLVEDLGLATPRIQVRAGLALHTRAGELNHARQIFTLTYEW